MLCKTDHSFISNTLIRYVVAAVVLIIAVMSSPVAAQNDDLPFVGMSSCEPATRWEQALVSGNGTLGAMVFGDPERERIVLNHERLYEPLLDQPCPVPDLSGSLKTVRELMLAEKYQQAYQYSWNYAKQQGFPGIQWTDPYHPACSLEITQNTSNANNYLRTTNFENGSSTSASITDAAKPRCFPTNF